MATIDIEGVRAPLVAGRTLLDFADDLALDVPESCRRSGRCHECIVEVRAGAAALTAPTPAEQFLAHGYRLACQARVASVDLDVEIGVLRRRLRILQAPDVRQLELDPAVTVVDGRLIYRGDASAPGDDLGPVTERPIGIALDVGTTTVALELLDLATGDRIASTAFENPQRFGGSDVMGRIAFDGLRTGELRRVLRRTLNVELRRLYRDWGVARTDVCEAVVVGNTTMRDLFFGLDVQPIGRTPFRSTTEQAWRAGLQPTSGLVRLAHELGIYANPRARIVAPPLIACHVGADAAADLVATNFEASGSVVMVVDVGTNTEVVLTDGHRIVAASSPAGPAFEGGLVRHAMPASDGAIEHAWLRSSGFEVQTVGDAPPEGICGSGLIDVLAELRRAGELSTVGAFHSGAKHFPVAPGAGIALTRADASHLAQAKAANAVAQFILLRRLGLTPDRIDRLWLAGGFASAIDVENAIAIGFLLPVDPARVVRAGNAALVGARELLASRHARVMLDRLVGRIEHVELERETDFFDLFVDACRFEPVEWSGSGDAQHGSRSGSAAS